MKHFLFIFLAFFSSFASSHTYDFDPRSPLEIKSPAYFTSTFDRTDPASNGAAVGSSLFTMVMDRVTGAIKFKVDVTSPLSGNAQTFDVHLHGPVATRLQAFNNTTQKWNPDQSDASAAAQRWSFHDVASGDWLYIPNMFNGGDTADNTGTPGSDGMIANATYKKVQELVGKYPEPYRSQYFDLLGLTRYQEVMQGFWYGHTQTADGNRVRGFIAASAAPVPVPAAVWLLGSALVGLGLFRRKEA